MKLDPKRIRIDGGTQPRAALLIDVMEGYAEDMRKGDEFPPITVFFDGKDYWLADGFHRLGAALRVRPDDPIEAEVIQGTQSDAQWYSYGVNKTHGLRRTNEDKARAVKAALRHPKSGGLSDAAIADHVGVHRETVLKYRRDGESDLSKTDKSDATTPPSDLSKTDKSRYRTGRDGRTIDTANIGKRTAERNGKRRVTVYSASQAQEARDRGQPFRYSSFVKLELPTNHIHNCAYDLLRFLPFEYLEKVFREIVRIHQERLEKETSQ